MALAVTLGDPWGIGPEVVAGALAGLALQPGTVRVVGPGFAWRAMLAREPALSVHDSFFVEVPAGRSSGKPGNPPVDGGRVVLDTLAAAVSLVRSGEAQALVTAPLNKSLVHRLDPEFVGHTEYLGQAFGVEEPTMTFVGPRYVTALVTTHVSIRSLPDWISEERVYRHIRRLWAWLADRYGPSVRLGVAGLNPHAGEGGAFGDEEARVIAPAIARARSEGINAEGPFPADSIYREAGSGKRFAGVLAMYHDQALVLFKATDEGQGVNMTLGLPVVRTSPDHGTAYDIAGRGRADWRSMAAAFSLVLPPA
jgi:4-hydroxythreonine-4-phosphate dehydrogenase